jgi:hypothetical protein
MKIPSFLNIFRRKAAQPDVPSAQTQPQASSPVPVTVSQKPGASAKAVSPQQALAAQRLARRSDKIMPTPEERKAINDFVWAAYNDDLQAVIDYVASGGDINGMSTFKMQDRYMKEFAGDGDLATHALAIEATMVHPTSRVRAFLLEQPYVMLNRLDFDPSYQSVALRLAIKYGRSDAVRAIIEHPGFADSKLTFLTQGTIGVHKAVLPSTIASHHGKGNMIAYLKQQEALALEQKEAQEKASKKKASKSK